MCILKIVYDRKCRFILFNICNVLPQKVEMHPLFPVVDILCYNSMLYTVPIIVAMIYLCYE